MRKVIFILSALSIATVNQIMASEAEVNFYGTLLEAPLCEINNNEIVVVDFGEEVMTTRIDGRNYRQPIDLNLDCSMAVSVKQMVKIDGARASFDNDLLDSGISDMGFALYRDESQIKPDTWLNFNYPDEPKLFVVPVKNSGATLSGGVFNVLASIVVEYQ